MNKDSEETEWFEVTEDLWREQYEIRPKLRLLADQNISREMVSELRHARINVTTASERRVSNLSDTNLFEYAKSHGMVILTTDRDFWSDRRFPVHKGGGAVVLEAPPSDVMKCLRSFGLAYGTFAKSFGGSAVNGIRIKASEDRFLLKMKSPSGSRVTYEMKLEKRTLWAREIVAG